MRRSPISGARAPWEARIIVERTVRLYGKLADVCGPVVTVPGGDLWESVETIRARVVRVSPALAGLLSDARVRGCVDGAVAADDETVAPSMAVEFIPAVSGG